MSPPLGHSLSVFAAPLPRRRPNAAIVTLRRGGGHWVLGLRAIRLDDEKKLRLGRVSEGRSRDKLHVILRAVARRASRTIRPASMRPAGSRTRPVIYRTGRGGATRFPVECCPDPEVHVGEPGVGKSRRERRCAPERWRTTSRAARRRSSGQGVSVNGERIIPCERSSMVQRAEGAS
jgi:hypothetical protein